MSDSGSVVCSGSGSGLAIAMFDRGRAVDRCSDGHLRGVALMVVIWVAGYLLLAWGV